MATKSTGWSCKVSVSTSDNKDDSINITAKAIWVNSGWRYSMSPIYAYVTINGTEYEVYSGGTKGKIETDNTSETELGSQTITIRKSYSSQTIKCSAKLVSSSTYESGTKTSGTESVLVSAKTSYTYKYNANGGSGAPGNQTKWYNEDLKISSTKPTRTGYSFKNWKDNEGGTRDPGSTAHRNANLTMTAQWTENTYTIKFNANGGSGAPGNQTKWYNEDLKISSTKPTRTGYSFQGWATSASGSVAYSAGGTFKTNANTTLYAVWKANTYTIKFNANGGSGAPGNQTATHDVNLTLSSTKPTRTGYTFKGWSTSSSGSVTHNPGHAYKFTANTTLYAVWQINTYTVSFNGNGATSGSTAAQTKNYNTTFALPANGFVKTNYNFKGWATSAGGSVVYNNKANFTVTSNVTLYAVWELAYVKPILNNYTAQRCDTASQISETGDCLRIDFKWSVFKPIGHEDQYANPTLRTYWVIQGQSNWNYVDTQLSGTGGTTSLKLADGQINVNNSYRIYSVITDNTGNSTNSQFETIQSVAFPIDVKVGGTGIAFGKVAENDGYADFQFIPRFYLDRSDGTYVSPQYIVNGLARTPLEILPDAGNTTGDGLRLGVNGIFIAGSGESSSNLWDVIKSSISPGEETTYITSDYDVNIITNANNLPNDNSCKFTFTFKKDGSAYFGDSNKSFHAELHLYNSAVHAQLSANSGGAFGIYSTTHSKWIIADAANGIVQLNGNKFNVNTSGETAVGKSYKIPNNGSAGYGLCNSDGKSIIRDHNNNNVTVDATGGTLYIAYQNTNGINIFSGLLTLSYETQVYNGSTYRYYKFDNSLCVGILSENNNGQSSYNCYNNNITGTNQGLYIRPDGKIITGGHIVLEYGNIYLAGSLLSRKYKQNIITHDYNACTIGPGSGTSDSVTTYIRGNNVRLYAHKGGGVYLGSSGSTAVTSDENLKDISEMDSKYENFFMNLKPITYRYKNNGHRDHIGFGARQVEKSLKDVGLSNENFAGVLRDTNVTISADEAGTEEDIYYDELYSLRYEEFIALNTKMIQKCLNEIEQLKQQIKELKGE